MLKLLGLLLIVAVAALQPPPALATFQPTAVFAAGNAGMWAIDLATGKQLWYLHGYPAHPARLSSDGELVFLCDDFNFRALHTNNGSQLWGFRNNVKFSTPPIVMADDGVVFGTWDNVLIRLWPNGTQRWITDRFDSGGNTGDVMVPAVDENGIIYHVTYNGAVVAVTPLNGTILWHRQLNYQVTGSPALGPNNTIYVVAGGMDLVALHRSNGSTVWSVNYAPFNLEDTLTSSPAVRPSDGVVFLETLIRNKPTGPVAISPQGQILWYSTVMDNYLGCTVAATNQSLYLTSGSTFYGLDSQGHVVWETPTTPKTADEASLVPLAADIVIGVDSYSVVALNSITGSVIWNFTTLPEGTYFHTPALCPCPPPSDFARCLLSCL